MPSRIHVACASRHPSSASRSPSRLPGIPIATSPQEMYYYWAPTALFRSANTNIVAGDACCSIRALAPSRTCKYILGGQVRGSINSDVTSLVATLGSHAGTDEAVLEQQRLTLPTATTNLAASPPSPGSALCTVYATCERGNNVSLYRFRVGIVFS